MKKIRILHMVSTLTKSSGVMGFIMNYYRNTDHDKIQFDFLYFEDRKITYQKEIEEMGGKIYKVGKPKISIKYVNKINNFFNIYGSQYKALHCHPIYSSVIFGYFAKKNNINHVIQHSHSSKFSNNLLGNIRNHLLSYLFRFSANHYMACSVEAKRLFKNKIDSDQEIIIINNAIDTNRFTYNNKNRIAVRKENNIDDDSFVIGNVGRFSIEKNHDYLIKLFKEITLINNNSVLLLAGVGGLKNDIQDKIKKLDLEEKVIFTGLISDVNRLLNAMDVFVLPSLYEGLGIVAIESQASGLPTFCSKSLPEDIFVTELSIKFDLDAEIKHTAQQIINYENYKTKNTTKKIIESGYDILTESKKLEDFYLSLK